MWLDGLRPRRSHRLLLALRVSFVLAALLPLVAPLLECSSGTAELGAAVRSLYALQCHQRVGRSFHFWSAALPVCARCYGIYLGLGLAALVGRPRLRPDAYKAWIVVGAVVVLVDVASEWVGLRAANAWFRLANGGLVAYGIALGMLQAVRPRRA